MRAISEFCQQGKAKYLRCVQVVTYDKTKNLLDTYYKSMKAKAEKGKCSKFSEEKYKCKMSPLGIARGYFCNNLGSRAS